jgi:hypothetical protein
MCRKINGSDLYSAAHNGLVGGSNPPGPTRQSNVRRDFLLLPNGPELGGSAARVRVSAETNDTEQAFSAELSLGSEFRFPATDTRRK